jgi:hypothetical protein
VHRADWQTITWMLVSAIVVYVLIGPNIVTVALAVIGTLGAFAKAGLEQWERWQLTQANKERSAGNS